MSAIKGTVNNFQEEVLNSTKPVLVDFWASWCGPCRLLSPIVDEIAAEHPELKVVKVNIDEEAELAERYSIMTIPTLCVVKKGEIVKQVSGARPKQQVLALLQD